MFYFRLALALGMTVEEMLNRMSSRELSEWMAYYSIEPFGDIRGDVQAAMICQSSVAPHLGKGERVPSLDKFMPFVESDKKVHSEETMRRMCKQYAASFKGKSPKRE